MNECVCAGLPAGWVNGWLAAVGATVLDPRLRLHWTMGDAAVAVVSAKRVDPVAALVESWPDGASLRDLPIADDWGGQGRLKHRVQVADFGRRAESGRRDPDCWALSSTMTDLSVNRNGAVGLAPFVPGVPKGTTLHARALRVHADVGLATTERIRASLMGQAERVQGNGLGFDLSRLGSLADETDRWVEPVVELLAFFGLALFPMRGSGGDRRHGSNPDERQRGWRSRPGGHDPREFLWPAWEQPLDAWGIDALLDIWNPWRRATWRSAGVHAGWRSVRYERRATGDPTRAIGAERL